MTEVIVARVPTKTHEGPPMDEADSAIIAERTALMDKDTGLRQGDWIEFACGTVRRVSNVYHAAGEFTEKFQTSSSGSWHIDHNGYVSMSGALHGLNESAALILSGIRSGGVWFFHHGEMRAHNGVDTEIVFRVYKSSEEASR